MAHPTYRDLTKQFRTLRAGLRKDQITERSSSRDATQRLIPINIGNSSQPTTTQYQYNPKSAELPPVWQETLESLDRDTERIEQQIGMLKEYHSRRQKVVFEDNKSTELDQNIQETTRSITKLFQNCKRKLQKIATEDDKNKEGSSLGFEDRAVRFNVMKSRATTIQELTKVFRVCQRNYLQAMKKKQEKENRYIDDDSIAETIPNLDRIAEDGFTDEQMQRLELMQNDSSKRTQEIIQIAKSVHELAQLFQELNVLVVEQGSLLDRIDYNVEQTLDSLQKSKVHLDKAEVHQKRSRTALCIIVLLALVGVAGFILIIRNV